MTEYRDRNGNNIYVKDFGTDKLPLGTVIISNRTGCYLQLMNVAGAVRPISNRHTRTLEKKLGKAKRRGF